jgi:hypothetical protein
MKLSDSWFPVPDTNGVPRVVTHVKHGDYQLKMHAAIARMRAEHVLPVHERAHYWHRAEHVSVLHQKQAF